MLVLSRRLNESVVIGDDIFVSIVAVQGGQYRIGIEAPRDVPVHRLEIWQEIKRQEKDRNGGPA